ncbi:GNAT family N-acetyltransferase [Desulfolutivibrio sp.]|uniref:GNAT family N-acetyltransferase n=1 Tax=Desulfolutivibrio sp. TaxID=2773296 RepID=UPI002F9609DE
MHESETVSSLALSLASALGDDPFYRSLVADCEDDAGVRLARYFEQSIREGHDIGQVRQAGDDGCAVWITSCDLKRILDARENKLAALGRLLGPVGFANYRSMVANMERRLPPLIPESAWYLSIMGVAVARQGQGLGGRLLASTLAEADSHGAMCYLETFNPRSVPFYARQGFAVGAEAVEPLTGAGYQVMVRAAR